MWSSKNIPIKQNSPKEKDEFYGEAIIKGLFFYSFGMAAGIISNKKIPTESILKKIFNFLTNRSPKSIGANIILLGTIIGGFMINKKLSEKVNKIKNS